MRGGKDIAEAKCEDRRSANIEAAAQSSDYRDGMHWIDKRRVHAEEDEAVGEDQQRRPDSEKQQQSERAVEAVDLLAAATPRPVRSDVGPWSPGEEKENTGDAKAAHGTAWQDDGLEGIQQNACETDATEDNCCKVHDVTVSASRGQTAIDVEK